MSHILLNNNGLVINMNIDPKGRINGEVYEEGNRFGSIDFRSSVVGKTPEDDDRDISIQLPGVRIAGGNNVNAMTNKIETAKEYAESTHDLMLNFRQSSDYYLNSIKSRIKAKDVDSLVLFLALTPKTVDSEAARDALKLSIESGLLGDVISKTGLDAVSDNVFTALDHAVLGIVGHEEIHPLEEEKDGDPNKVMATYLRELQAA